MEDESIGRRRPKGTRGGLRGEQPPQVRDQGGASEPSRISDSPKPSRGGIRILQSVRYVPPPADASAALAAIVSAGADDIPLLRSNADGPIW
ncbi:hypothetical protein HPP92_027047 [Vanilla planifolia]|uniref:Uncharacterized protein n=1 Tax=Vanilla planifolia TaxID=51239 RepID=A0A835U600_VANPL|nr:hypothetical protein HPP92_027166 [Vanilla planifolia]KAG0449888.1 hypothetical protein HPP92_027047 [Vanilla planifolia]